MKIRILFVLKHVMSSSFKVLLLCQYFNPLQKLTSYLIFIKFLQVLNLDSIQLRSDSIQKIATNLPNLTELNLRNTWLSKRAVLSLVNHLTAVNIEKLNLEMLKNVDDEIVRKLVSKCHKLNELNLKETSITSFSIKIIIQYLKATIVRLDLSENNIDKANIVDLEKRLPNLKQVKLVSMDLNHIGIIAFLFPQIRDHSIQICDRHAYFNILFVTSIHQSTIFFIKILIHFCFVWIEIIQPFLHIEGFKMYFRASLK